MQIQQITNLNNYNKYQAKPHKAEVRYTAPLACDTFTPSVSFKGIKEFREALKNDDAEALRHEIEVNGVDVNTRMGDEYNTPAIMYVSRPDRINCFRELRRHPELDMYAEDNKGLFCFMSACFYGYKYIVQDLVDDSNYDINHQSSIRGKFNGLMNACRNDKDEIVDIILRRPDVDLSLIDSYGRTTTELARNDCNDSIVRKLEAYKPRVDRRKYPKKIDINKIAPSSAIWTEEEKQNIAKLIEENKYSEIVKLLEEKGVKLNEEYEQFRKQMTAIKEETEKSVRESITAQIRKEEKEKANKVIENQKADLAKQQEELEQEKQTLDNMIKNYQTLIAEDVINAREVLGVGYRALYGADSEELPKTMDFDEQTIYVLNVLGKRQDKLTATSSETPNKITKAIQDDTGNISLDGLKFLERAIDACKEKFSEKDLLDSIKCVKGSYGLFDMKKTALFISNIAWKDNSIRSVIQKVEKYGLK